MADRSQQTEKATPHRLKKAREKGDFPSAREFVASFQFLGLVILGAAWFPAWFGAVERAVRTGIRAAFFRAGGAGAVTGGDVAGIFTAMSREALLPLAVMGVILMALTAGLQLASNGMGFSTAKLAPDFTRLNPVSRLKETAAANVGQLVQALVTIPAMLWLVWSLVREKLPEILRLPLVPLAPGAAEAGDLIHGAMRRAAFALAAVGAVMLGRERLRYQKRLRMSKQEIRDEAKEIDGNPQIKARVRRLQRDLRRRNMMRDVPTATAVIVNPTHYAVALRYEQGTMAAPSVVAKGRNYLAARIRQRAIGHEIPIIENPPLAQALYKSVEVGQDIPPYLYRAVAEILAYVFRAMGRGRRG
jgi:flagellar biosynthetic protein FlhB